MEQAVATLEILNETGDSRDEILELSHADLDKVGAGIMGLLL